MRKTLVGKFASSEKAREQYDKEAKERQRRKPADSVKENLPEQNQQSRDAAGKTIGVARQTISDWLITNADTGKASKKPDARVKPLPRLTKVVQYCTTLTDALTNTLEGQHRNSRVHYPSLTSNPR